MVVICRLKEPNFGTLRLVTPIVLCIKGLFCCKEDEDFFLVFVKIILNSGDLSAAYEIGKTFLVSWLVNNEES